MLYQLQIIFIGIHSLDPQKHPLSKTVEKCIPHLYHLLNNNLASINGQKCLCESCAICHHMPRGLEGISLTHASSNRHTDLGPSCEPSSGPWLGSSLSLPQPRSLGEHCLGPSPTDEKLLWKSSSPAKKFQHAIGTKRKMFGCIREGKWTIWLYPHHLSPKVAQLSAKTNFPFPAIGERKSVRVSTGLPQTDRTLPKRLISLLPHPEYWVMSYMTGSRKRPGER